MSGVSYLSPYPSQMSTISGPTETCLRAVGGFEGSSFSKSAANLTKAGIKFEVSSCISLFLADIQRNVLRERSSSLELYASVSTSVVKTLF